MVKSFERAFFFEREERLTNLFDEAVRAANSREAACTRSCRKRRSSDRDIPVLLHLCRSNTFSPIGLLTNDVRREDQDRISFSILSVRFRNSVPRTGMSPSTGILSSSARVDVSNQTADDDDLAIFDDEASSLP